MTDRLAAHYSERDSAREVLSERALAEAARFDRSEKS